MKRCSGFVFGLFVVLFFGVPVAGLSAEELILPESTRITLQLNDTLSTRSSSEGDAFTAVVTMPVYSRERIVIPKGSIVNGSISRILRPGRFKGKAVMNLLFQSISIPGRGQAPITATLVRVNPDSSAPGGRTEEPIERKEYGDADDGKNSVLPGTFRTGTAAKVSGEEQAATGGESGVSVSQSTMFSSPGNELEIHRGAVLDIVLNRPLTIPSEKSAL